MTATATRAHAPLYRTDRERSDALAERAWREGRAWVRAPLTVQVPWRPVHLRQLDRALAARNEGARVRLLSARDRRNVDTFLDQIVLSTVEQLGRRLGLDEGQRERAGYDWDEAAALLPGLRGMYVIGRAVVDCVERGERHVLAAEAPLPWEGDS